MADSEIVPERPASASEHKDEDGAFDFEGHRLRAIDRYQRVRPLFQDYANSVRSILNAALVSRKIKIGALDARAKGLDSLGNKAKTPSEQDSNRPKYQDPLKEITDLAGVRVITFFPRTVNDVDEAITSEFEVIEKIDKGAALRQEEKFGYQSVHYVVRLLSNRTILPEYRRYANLVAEIQVRTVLQHAWAEIEHDIQYKAAEAIPPEIRRRFSVLAGLLELADREFQLIQGEDEDIRVAARVSVQQGRLGEVELSPDALKAYLDEKLGSDGRVAEWSYNYEVGTLRRLGFKNLQQVDDCIAGLDDDRISRLLWGGRQGQISRFDDLLLAGMGENFIRRHPWRNAPYWPNQWKTNLQKLTKAGVQVRNYSPD